MALPAENNNTTPAQTRAEREQDEKSAALIAFQLAALNLRRGAEGLVASIFAPEALNEVRRRPEPHPQRGNLTVVDITIRIDTALGIVGIKSETPYFRHDFGTIVSDKIL